MVGILGTTHTCDMEIPPSHIIITVTFPGVVSFVSKSPHVSMSLSSSMSGCIHGGSSICELPSCRFSHQRASSGCQWVRQFTQGACLFLVHPTDRVRQFREVSLRGATCHRYSFHREVCAGPFQSGAIFKYLFDGRQLLSWSASLALPTHATWKFRRATSSSQ